jgi:hypothetical protein
MAAWIPALKAILPYVTQIVTAAIPVFTTRSDQTKAAEVIPKQIQELQSAVTRNTESLKVLADQLQQVITSVDAGAIAIEREMRAGKRLAILAIVVAVVAILLSVATWLQ